MNIYLRELKAHKKSIIIWSLAMMLFVIMGMQKFSTITGSGNNAMLDLMDKMPKFLQTMWGMSSLDITTAIGYFGVLFPYLALMAGIHSSMLGSSIILKEERDKTVEFLMAKPVSRSKIITSKLLAALTNVIIFNIVTFVTSIFVLKSLSDASISKEILLSMIALFLIQVIFMIIGIGTAAIMKNSKKSGSITMFILIGTFFLSIIIDLSDKLEVLKILTPFKYFESKDFFASGYLNIWYILLEIAIIGIIILFTYKRYNKRDLSL